MPTAPSPSPPPHHHHNISSIKKKRIEIKRIFICRMLWWCYWNHSDEYAWIHWIFYCYFIWWKIGAVFVALHEKYNPVVLFMRFWLRHPRHHSNLILRSLSAWVRQRKNGNVMGDRRRGRERQREGWDEITEIYFALFAPHHTLHNAYTQRKSFCDDSN